LSAGDWQPGAPSRVIFSEGLARRYFRAENMIGRTISAGFGRNVEESEFFGVVPDLGLIGPGESRTEFFVKSPFDAAAGRVAVLARTTGLNAEVLSGITQAVERAVPQLPVPDAFPLRKFIDYRLAQQRLFARMIGLVAALSVLLAAVGLYGVVAFTVAGRRREMGIRLALGADRRDLANLVARYALGVVGVGVALGLMGAAWLEDVLDNLLFGLIPLDFVSYGGSILMFVFVAVLACWVPTRSAMRVDPAVTLRAD
jgi:ABC-type antimicrobial peptide transport system permease subunit